MGSKWKQVQSAFSIKDIGAYLMANLAKGLYTGPEVIREYVQNAVDSYVEFTTLIPELPENEVRVDVRERSVLIYDRGIGMGTKEVQEAKKIALPTKPQRDPQYVGFRKLGIWSGLTVCKKLIIETSKFGEPYQFRITMNFENIARDVERPISIKDLLDPNVRIERSDEKKDEHYTKIELQDILDQYHDLLDIEHLKQVIVDHCPTHLALSFTHSGAIEQRLKDEGINFYKIFVKGTQIFRDFPAGVTAPEWREIKVNGKPVALAWYCLDNRDTGGLKLTDAYQRRNFSLRIKNFAIGERGIYSSDEYGFFGPLDSPGNLDWYAGEIHIVDNELIPDTPRRRIEDSAYARSFIKELRSFYNDRTQATRVRSAYVSGKKHIEAAQLLLEVVKKNASEANKDALKKSLQLLETDERKSKATNKPKGNGKAKKASAVATQQAKVIAKKDVREPRQLLIKNITKVLGTRSKSTASAKGKKTASATSASSEVDISLSKPEEFLQKILVIIETVLGDDSEEYRQIAVKVERLFKSDGLI